MNFFSPIYDGDQFEAQDNPSQGESEKQIHISSDGLRKKSKKINKRAQCSSGSLVKKWFSLRAISSFRIDPSELEDMDLRKQQKYDFNISEIDNALKQCEQELKLKVCFLSHEILDMKTAKEYIIQFSINEIPNILNHKNIQHVEDSYIYDIQQHSIDELTKNISFNLFIVEIIHKRFQLIIFESIDLTLQDCIAQTLPIDPIQQMIDLLNTLNDAFQLNLVHKEINTQSILYNKKTAELKLSNHFLIKTENIQEQTNIQQLTDCFASFLQTDNLLRLSDDLQKLISKCQVKEIIQILQEYDYPNQINQNQ